MLWKRARCVPCYRCARADQRADPRVGEIGPPARRRDDKIELHRYINGRFLVSSLVLGQLPLGSEGERVAAIGLDVLLVVNLEGDLVGDGREGRLLFLADLVEGDGGAGLHADELAELGAGAHDGVGHLRLVAEGGEPEYELVC